jgi:hypothetical protein
MLSEAPPQAASSEEIEQALSYLRLLWGDEFLIGRDDQGYLGDAARRCRRAHHARGRPSKLGELMNDYPGTGAGDVRAGVYVPVRGRLRLP